MHRTKIVTLLGIRPDIIRMHKLIRLLDSGQKKYGYEHLYAHTGQHFDYELDELFYTELGVRGPDVNFNVGKTLQQGKGPTDFVYQTGLLFAKTAEFIESYRPDVVLFLGDTNSVLASLIVSRYRVPVVHIEGGGRSFDWRMPEEKCRIVIDHLSDAIYCYLPRYRDILLHEGVGKERITVIGNIIDDAVKQFLPRAEGSSILETLQVAPGTFALVTMHREENTSIKEIFKPKLMDIIRLSKEMPVIFPLMPRVKAYIKTFGLEKALMNSKVRVTKPLGFLEFLKLEKYANVVITDSGTVQEETLILGTPCLVSRLSTERPETIQAGATILSDSLLYEHAKIAIGLPRTWDKTVLNPYTTSPSDVVFYDIVKKIQSGYFLSSRMYRSLHTNPFVKEAYGQRV